MTSIINNKRLEKCYPIEGLFRDFIYENFISRFARKHRRITDIIFDIISLTSCFVSLFSILIVIMRGLNISAPVDSNLLLFCIALGGINAFILSETIKFFLLNLIVPPRHDMIKNHVYKPGKCEGGELYYQNHLPILELQYNDNSPFIVGEAHGYLCGAAIDIFAFRSRLSMNILLRLPRANRLTHTLAAIRKKIPYQYLEEIDGMVSGYNKWRREQPWYKRLFLQTITANDFILFHLTPDSLHFQPKIIEKYFLNQNNSPSSSTDSLYHRNNIACSTVVDRDDNGKLIFLRNMDWPSGGVSGTFSIIIFRQHGRNTFSTIEVGFPGLVGTLTGMNERSLCLAMNVCRGETMLVRGMPSIFYNRLLLEENQSIEEIKNATLTLHPLGPYHLTIVEEMKAAVFHFYQMNDENGYCHLIRSYTNEKPLVTFNHFYNPYPSDGNFVRSDARLKRFQEFYRNLNKKFIEKSISLPDINNRDTIHSVIMKPDTRSLKVVFDNCFAGEIQPMHSVNTAILFSK